MNETRRREVVATLRNLLTTDSWPEVDVLTADVRAAAEELERPAPLRMLMWCPECGERHVDAGRYAARPHHTHACQGCGHVWRPAVEDTVGVRHLRGFKDPPCDDATCSTCVTGEPCR